MPRRAVTLIVNPNAGGLLDRNISPDDIAARIMDAGLDVDLLTGRGEELADRVKQARAMPAEIVAVAGGDGTINSAAQLLADSDKTLAIIPSGTLNHLARDLGIPLDLDRAVAVLRDGEPFAIDVGDVNGRVFLCSSMIGFTSRLAGQREHWRGRLNPWTWIRVLVRLSGTLYRDRRVEVRIGEPPVAAFHARHLTVAVSGYEEAPGRVFTRGRLDTGQFGVYAVRSPKLSGMLRLYLAALVGRWRRDPEITAIEARTLSVTNARPRLRVLNDGEIMLLDTPLRYRIRSGSLKVLRPRPEDAPPAPGAGPDGP